MTWDERGHNPLHGRRAYWLGAILLIVLAILTIHLGWHL